MYAESVCLGDVTSSVYVEQGELRFVCEAELGIVETGRASVLGILMVHVSPVNTTVKLSGEAGEGE